MSDKIVKHIFETMDYDKFKMYKNNRGIVASHVDRLKKSIFKEDAGSVFPIVVGPDFEIYDGQHRFNSRKSLGLPIYYVFGEPMSPPILAMLNASILKWSLENFVKLYAGFGMPDYIKIEQDCKFYETTTQGLFRGACASGWPVEFWRPIIEGEFEYTDALNKKVNAFHTHRIKDCRKLKGYTSIRFIRALGLLFKCSKYSPEVMKHQVDKYIEVYTPSVTYNGAVDSLLHLYNYNAKNRPVITRSDIGMR